jgi:glycosyltransferase involved in cell wall biosynthesis
MKPIDLSIIIPFYNEEDNVRFVLDGIHRVFKDSEIGYEIIPVANGSVDRSPEIIADCCNRYDSMSCVEIKSNKGLGWGLRKGFEAAQGTYICYFGGDGQTCPEDVFKMYRYLQQQKEKDLIVGKRVRRDDGPVRHFISKTFNSSFKILFNTKLNDINGTPKIFKVARMCNYQWRSDGWFIDAELILCAMKQKLKIHEYPVSFRKRQGGKTHINIAAILEFMRKMIYYFVRKRSVL